MFTIVANRDFSLLWIGGLVSALGDQVLTIALPFYVYRLTGSVLDTGTITIFYFLPAVLFGSVAGVFVDRWNLKQTLIVTNLAQAVILLPLLRVHSSSDLWITYCVAFGLAMLSLFVNPATSALVPRVVSTEHLVSANALYSVSNNVSRVVGPPLGGVLLAWTGLTIVTVADSVSFLAAAAMIALLAVPSGIASASPRVVATAVSRWTGRWRDWLDGLRLVRCQRDLALLFVVGGTGTLADAMLGPLIVPFVRDFLKGTAVTYGWISMATGLGGLLAAILVGRVAKRHQPMNMVSLGLTFVGLIAFLRYNIVILPVTLVTFWLGGMGAAVWNIGWATLLQTRTPDAYRGRVFGASGTTTALTLLAGTGLASILGDRLGLLPLLELSASLYLVAAVLAHRLSSLPFAHFRRRHTANHAPTQES